MKIFLFTSLLILCACSATMRPANQVATSTKARIANTSECPNGGVVIETFTDDTLTSTNNVCNGAPGIGVQGERGEIGQQGSAGHSVVTATVSSLTCQNGGVTIFLATDLNDDGLINFNHDDGDLKSVDLCNGSDGARGAQGESGRDGKDGVSPSPVPVVSTPFTPVGVYDPCGNTPNKYNEVFLKLANGQYMASFSDDANGKNTRLSLLKDGSYVTTDGTNCYFSVKDNGTTIFNEHF